MDEMRYEKQFSEVNTYNALNLMCLVGLCFKALHGGLQVRR